MTDTSKVCNSETRSRIWGLSLHICSQIEEDITNITSPEKVVGQKQHKEELKGGITIGARDSESIRKKHDICIDSLDPGKHWEVIRGLFKYECK